MHGPFRSPKALLATLIAIWVGATWAMVSASTTRQHAELPAATNTSNNAEAG
jgi:hypothetical protein